MAEDIRSKLAIRPEQARRTVAPVTPDQAAGVTDDFAQERALAAVELGLSMADGKYARSHYNIAVVGPQSTGRTAKTIRFVERRAERSAKRPTDKLCLHDFDDPHRALIVKVPAAAGHEIRKRLKKLGKFAVEQMPQKIGEFRSQRQTELNKLYGKIWKECDDKIKPLGCTVVPSKNGPPVIKISSIANPDQPASKEEVDKIIENDVDKKLDSLFGQAVEIFNQTVREANALVASHNAATEAGARKWINDVLTAMTAPLRALAGPQEPFERYLAELEKIILESGLRQEEARPAAAMILGHAPSGDYAQDLLERLTDVILLTDNRGIDHPPVVYVEVPNHTELFGAVKVQVINADGGMRVDHTMIETCAFLKADGGDLIVDLNKLLRLGGSVAFQKLLQVVSTQKLTIESRSKFVDSERAPDYRTTEIPINVRVIVLCDRRLDHALRHIEPEYDNLFRIVAEFDDQMDAEAAPGYVAAFVGMCRAENPALPEFSPAAVAKLTEIMIRRTDDQRKASAEVGVLKDYINEAGYLTARSGALIVGPEQVRATDRARFDRQALDVRRDQEFLDRKVLMDHRGSKAAQINAFVYRQYSKEIAYGAPQRITGRCYAGDDMVVLVQRVVKVTGPTMNTSIEDLSGFLAGKFGRQKPMRLAVQLSFEQFYGSIEGDSASLAEAIVTISAITGLPVDQRLGITGSMNQMGEAQPIGGINEKIEGHFGALKRRGLLAPDSGHGTVMPIWNLDNLMLDEEIVEAMKQGLYRIYAVTTLDEALEIFLGKPAAEIYVLAQKKIDEMNDEDEDEDEKKRT